MFHSYDDFNEPDPPIIQTVKRGCQRFCGVFMVVVFCAGVVFIIVYIKQALKDNSSENDQSFVPPEIFRLR
jgi:hypothetical protein